MSLFVCQECRTIENTALCSFWLRTQLTKDRALCSACDPEIRKWHNRFPRVTYNGIQTVQWIDGEWVDGRDAMGNPTDVIGRGSNGV